MREVDAQGPKRGWRPNKRRIAIAIGIALLWSGAWGAGSYGFFRGAASSDAEVATVLALPRGAEAGRDARLEATVAPGPVVSAPLSGRPCVFSSTRVVLSGSYRDLQDRVQQTSMTVVDRRNGPAMILLDASSSAGGGTRVEVPTEAWQPPTRPDAQRSIDEVPANLDVSQSEMASARSKFIHSPDNGRLVTITGTSVEEWTLAAGAKTFVAGHVEERDGRLRVAPSQALGKVIFVADTEEGYLRDRHGSAHGLRTAGFVFIGLASLPWLFALLVIGLARRKQRAAASQLGDGEAI